MATEFDKLHIKMKNLESIMLNVQTMLTKQFFDSTYGSVRGSIDTTNGMGSPDLHDQKQASEQKK